MKSLIHRLDAGIKIADEMNIPIVEIQVDPRTLQEFWERLLPEARVKEAYTHRELEGQYRDVDMVPSNHVSKNRLRFVFRRGHDLDKWEAKAKHLEDV